MDPETARGRPHSARLPKRCKTEHAMQLPPWLKKPWRTPAKLRFVALDARHTTFEAHVSGPAERELLASFERWCSESMPPHGEHWARFDHDVPRKGPEGSERPAAKRILLVFGDERLARRFFSVWG